MRKQSVVYSFCIHLALVTLLLLTAALHQFTSTSHRLVTTLEVRNKHLTAPPRLSMSVAPGSEGGGHRNRLPPEQGQVARVAGKVFVLPMVRPREAPQIAVPAGLADMPQIVAEVPIGIPTGVTGTNSGGPGEGKTIGTGDGNRVGPGTGVGPGNDPGDGRGDAPRQRLSALPQVLWKIEPEYSEEARKARFQGSVMLALEVDSEGRPRKIRIVRSLGLGLDERAIEAVSQWRFKPGVLNGRPVNAPVSIEVSFRLL